MAATETAARPERSLDGKKAQRIVEAMRASVAARGAAGATFDHVAGEAGVSRGLLHYYFGTKERLLVEVVRHDCDLRLGALEDRLEAAQTVDELVGLMVAHLEDMIDVDSDSFALIFELFTASRHNAELGEAMADLYSRVRATTAAALRAKQEQGVVSRDADPESVAAVLIALADGIAMQVLSDREWDRGPLFTEGVEIARRLLAGE